jgi:hypothetical protein
LTLFSPPPPPPPPPPSFDTIVMSSTTNAPGVNNPSVTEKLARLALKEQQAKLTEFKKSGSTGTGTGTGAGIDASMDDTDKRDINFMDNRGPFDIEDLPQKIQGIVFFYV